MDIAISPCPNDTYLFSAWAEGAIEAPSAKFHYLDIDELNQRAKEKIFSLTKLSLYAYGQVMNDYRLLPLGGAIVDKEGPLLVAKEEISLEKLTQKRIAFPGSETTAHFLSQILLPPIMDKRFLRYDRILPAVAEGDVEGGVVIHEGRFTLDRYGVKKIVDLGVLWKERFNYPLPLGVLAVRRDLSSSLTNAIIDGLKRSLAYANSHRSQITPNILRHADQQEESVVWGQVLLYVNEETAFFSSKGREAIEFFLQEGHRRGLIAPPPRDLFVEIT